MSPRLSLTGGNSIFNVGVVAADLCADFFPAARALHNGHGCSPSNASLTASATELVVRLAASIVVHATVCSAAQCAPVVKTRARTTRNFPLRVNTK